MGGAIYGRILQDNRRTGLDIPSRRCRAHYSAHFLARAAGFTPLPSPTRLLHLPHLPHWEQAGRDAARDIAVRHGVGNHSPPLYTSPPLPVSPVAGHSIALVRGLAYRRTWVGYARFFA